ncbi:hypothetical protein KQ939_17585 [Planococcus sp. CP5-4]|uniref:hypothetical protein n=1 Tax=unclassified Planococcus (in: firmicutes) TaxID=2662419 RepID=UPI001C22598E|nr:MULTISPECIES: hypothetical protein [unclassified Planococcus (in: firmicutes)]MBU9675155.1 hypothetical protein [Planococcus sp. CP5-4_YE]MBV0910688.1 hypothetical protein [Planococcus sp. CP5-4_UN]MBW6065470.1 hypothetical protein [Planococcus sp. CP5-4]
MSEFNDFPNTMVITLKEILDGKKSVLYVSHDGEDGMWQFLDGSDELDIDNARIVTIEEILKVDSSLWSLFDLSIGWKAERVDRDTKWLRQANV